MILIPNSYGSMVQEGNPCHEPAGSPKGGQFCSGEGGRLASVQTSPSRMFRGKADHLVAAMATGYRRLVAANADKPELASQVAWWTKAAAAAEAELRWRQQNPSTRDPLKGTVYQHSGKVHYTPEDRPYAVPAKHDIPFEARAKLRRGAKAAEQRRATARARTKARLVKARRKGNYIHAGVLRQHLVALGEANDCHLPAGTPEGGQFCSKGGVPVEPGTTPIPPGMVRGYHYTDNLTAVLGEGLRRDRGRGHTYGEPDMIWFSTARPGDFKEFVEVHIPIEDMDLNSFARSRATPQEEIDKFNSGNHDFTVRSSVIPPERFVTHFRPWHAHYRYLMENWPPDDPGAWRVTPANPAKDYIEDFLKIDDPDYVPAVQAWVKQVRAHGKVKVP